MERVLAALEPVLNIIEAILLLACAFIVASIFKKLALRGLSKTRLKAQLYEEVAAGKKKEQEQGPADTAVPAIAGETAAGPADKEVGDAPDAPPRESSLAGFLGALIYLIVFLLFIPAIFALLGIRHASAPIMDMLTSFWDRLPNILACVVILVVGFMLAKLVRQLLIPIFRRLKIDKIQEKAGVETTASGRLSSTLAYIVYVLILIPIIITALRSLHIPAISNPAIQMLNRIFDFIPSIIVAVLIIVIGNVIARFAGQISSRLIEASGLDDKMTRFIGEEQRNYPLSRVIGTLIHVVIVVFFIVQSFSVLGLETFNNIGNTVINYLPRALSAIVILGICIFAASAARNAVSKVMNTGVGKVVYFSVWVIGIFMALNQLGIARSLVDMAFTAIVGAVAVSVAIAFGVGGKDFAAQFLEKLASEDGKKDKKKKRSTTEEKKD